MSKIIFVDVSGQPVYGVVALRNGIPVAADVDNASLKLDPGTYVFKLIGFKDLEYTVTGNAEVTLQDSAVELPGVTVTDYRTWSWGMILMIVVAVVSLKKISE
jgi:hypothetical protein